LIQLALPLEAPSPVRRPRLRRLPTRRSIAALERLAAAYGRKLGMRRRLVGLRVVFNSRLRTAAGRADFSGRTIELNPRLLDRHPEELLPTLVHELCHLAVGARAGHGPRWRSAVETLGYRPETCHQLDVSDLAPRRRRRWAWRCSGCGALSIRASRAAQRYLCGDCGRGLRLVGPLTAEAVAASGES